MQLQARVVQLEAAKAKTDVVLGDVGEVLKHMMGGNRGNGYKADSEAAYFLESAHESSKHDSKPRSDISHLTGGIYLRRTEVQSAWEHAFRRGVFRE